MNLLVGKLFLGLICSISQVYAAVANADEPEMTHVSFAVAEHTVYVYALGGGCIETCQVPKGNPGDMGFTLRFPNSDRYVDLYVFRSTPEMADSIHYSIYMRHNHMVDPLYVETGEIDYMQKDKHARHERPSCRFRHDHYFHGMAINAQPPALFRTEFDERREDLQISANERDIQFNVIFSRSGKELSHVFGFRKQKPY